LNRHALALALVLAGVALAADNPVTVFHKNFDNKDEASRLAAVAELGRIQSRVVVNALATPVAHDPSANVRRAAAKVLGGQWWSWQAATTLGKALKIDDDPSDVTLTIIEALGETQSDAAVTPLVRSLKVRPRVYAGGVSQAKQITDLSVPILDALHKIGSALAVEDLVNFLSSEEPGAGLRGKRAARAATDPLLKHAIAALTAITGESLRSPEEWGAWYDQNHSSFKTVVVLRCEITGKIYDKPTGKGICPGCGANPHECSSQLKTRFEKVPLQEKPAEEKPKGKKGT
jgi:hypothetical protein